MTVTIRNQNRKRSLVLRDQYSQRGRIEFKFRIKLRNRVLIVVTVLPNVSAQNTKQHFLGIQQNNINLIRIPVTVDMFKLFNLSSK